MFDPSKTIRDFVSLNAIKFFDILNLPTSFLENDPEQWNENPQFLEGLKIVQGLPATNDFAERGVALMQDFSGALAVKEEQKQFVLQIVENHRKRFPNPKKGDSVT